MSRKIAAARLAAVMTVSLFTTAMPLNAGAAEAAAAPLPPADATNKTAIVRVAAGASYIRLANMLDKPTRNYVEVYGLSDQATLGSFVVDVPAKASVQFQPEKMLQTFAPVNWDQPLVLYVENGRDKQVWQHIKSYPGSSVFFDASVCTPPPHLDYVQPGNVAINVHAGSGTGYISTITVHNFSDKTGRYEAQIYDTATGQQVGATAFELKPRQSLTRSGSYYAQQAGPAAPETRDRYLNVEFVSVGDPDARIVVGHEVLDAARGYVLNLSNPCALNGGLVSAF
jgi:hypothetical protein